MNARSAYQHVIGVTIGASAVAVVPWFLLKHSRMSLLDLSASVAVVALMALLIGITTTRAVGTAIFAAGITLLTNDALLAGSFATILGFGHLSLADAFGLWPASALLILAISSAYVVIGSFKRRWLVAVAVAVTVLLSWPAKLSSEFFV
jgi:hypothetical protein